MDRDDFDLDVDIDEAVGTTDDLYEEAAETWGSSAGAGSPLTDEEEDDAVAPVGDVPIDPSIPTTSRKVRRRGRRTRMRSKTIAMKRLTKEEIRIGALMYPVVDEPRPRTRSECKEGQRPCPWVSCKHHLYLDVNPETGSIKLNFPDLEVWDMKDTCSLDVADRNGITLEEVGEIMNLTRERIRQVEVRGLLKLKTMSGLGPDDG
jgi:hypothetical protein